MGKCLCLDPGGRSLRRVGTVVGDQCHCKVSISHVSTLKSRINMYHVLCYRRADLEAINKLSSELFAALINKRMKLERYFK